MEKEFEFSPGVKYNESEIPGKNMSRKKNLAIILAGGAGIRFGERLPKQFTSIAGKTILEHSIQAFSRHPLIHELMLVVHPGYQAQAASIIRDKSLPKVGKILAGGQTRQESAYIGVNAAGENVENVLIHDAVRPLVPPDMIDALLQALENNLAVTPAVEPTDTIAAIDARDMIVDIPDRKLWRKIQTPQGFRREIIRQAHEMARERALENFPDDSSLVLFFKLADILVIPGSDSNIKITYPEDIALLNKLLT